MEEFLRTDNCRYIKSSEQYSYRIQNKNSICSFHNKVPISVHDEIVADVVALCIQNDLVFKDGELQSKCNEMEQMFL